MSILKIEVDDVDSPSTTIDGRGGPQPAWHAKVFYGPEAEGHYVEAISIGGPSLAIDFAMTILSHKKREGTLHGS